MDKLRFAFHLLLLISLLTVCTGAAEGCCDHDDYRSPGRGRNSVKHCRGQACPADDIQLPDSAALAGRETPGFGSLWARHITDFYSDLSRRKFFKPRPVPKPTPKPPKFGSPPPWSFPKNPSSPKPGGGSPKNPGKPDKPNRTQDSDPPRRTSDQMGDPGDGGSGGASKPTRLVPSQVTRAPLPSSSRRAGLVANGGNSWAPHPVLLFIAITGSGLVIFLW
ncbi:predicted protein [Uncinocarpus reesii 1704]|uniref:Uncharacterized protein n=1 Tax=Uncinocarpus reesii (strain UAMH 1704) TaxID=336963 RepID=C4JNU9_UNCRE|nr:uncharacterized protein UREG_04419 [Uncinocarpus reesii 1704]EEP79573.1 predicted protein [Uncinocarpus reesii 1704]